MAVDLGERPFVGRGETVEALHRRFEDARAGAGGVTLLIGETGVGKSTLVAELVRDMRRRGVVVLEGRAVAADAPLPFGLLRLVIASAREAMAEKPRTDERSDEVLIGFAPRLPAEPDPSSLGIEERLLAALRDADERPEGLRGPSGSGLAEEFLDLARHGPTVLVLEDLHRADELSLDAIEYVARQLEEQSLWILATVRPYTALSSVRRARLESFEKATRARRIVLPALTSSEVVEFLREREPQREFSDEEIARRFSETGGNPLLLEQLDRRLRSPSADADLPAVPDAPTVEARLPVPEDDAEERLLAVASVIGPEVPFSLLLRASGEEEERLAETVDRLVGRGLLLDRPGELLTFVDDRTRAEVYGRLTESRRRLLHRRVGEALEAMGSADLATIYVLARHFYLGKVDEKALRTNRAAAEIAERFHAPGVAREHLERALESFRRLFPQDRAGETEIVLELAQQIDRTGALVEAETLLRDHLGRPDVAKQVPRALLALGELYVARIQTDRGDWKAAEAATARLLKSRELTDHPAVLAVLHRLRGEALYYQGRYPASFSEHQEELRLAREGGNERAAALAQSRIASVLAMMGRSNEALAQGSEAAKALERLGDLAESSHAHLFVGVVLSGLPEPRTHHDAAIAEFDEAVRLAEKAHDPRRLGWALFNIADVQRDAGKIDAALETNQKARETLERIGDRFGLVQSMIVGGKIALDRGEYDRAEADLLEAYRLVRELKAPADEVDVVLRLAQLSYARGDRASARRRVKDLEKKDLPTLRPDVVADFERLRRTLADDERSGADERSA